MKILFINSSLNSGGSERVMAMIANYFSDQGIKTEMVLLRDKRPDVYFINPNIKLHRFSYKYSNKLIKALQRIAKIRKLVKDGNYDFVISFMYDINVTTLISLFGLKTPVIVSERADPNNRHIHSPIFSFLEKICYKKAKYIVVQTDQVAKFFDSHLRKKCIVIPNPVDEKLPVHRGPFKNKRIIAAGRFTEQKNFSMLIDAFVMLHANMNDADLYIFGDGPLKKTLVEKVADIGIRKNIHFPGFSDNLSSEMLKSSLYVSSSNYEGISNTMIEAMAIGIPCVCTNCPVGGSELMIENGVNGILTTVGNTEELYRAMMLVLSDTKIAQKISENGKKIRESYSIRNIGAKWINLCH